MEPNVNQALRLLGQGECYPSASKSCGSHRHEELGIRTATPSPGEPTQSPSSPAIPSSNCAAGLPRTFWKGRSGVRHCG